MAAFNFPSSPSNGQTYSANGVTFTYNSTSTAWVRSSAVGAQGAQGHQGHQGAAGAQGAQGSAGAQGAQGSAGSATISNNADNRVITGGSGTNLNGEANLNWNGQVFGVGTSSPNVLGNDNMHTIVSVIETSGTRRGQIELGDNQNVNGGGIGDIHFVGHYQDANHKDMACIKANASGSTSGQRGAYLSFETKPDGTAAIEERLRIDNAGRVMINQNTNLAGTAKLEVMGTGDNSYPYYSYAIGICDTQAYNVSNGTGMGIGFSYKHNSSGNTALGCGIRGFKENTTNGDYAGAMAFYTRANGAGAGERGRFSSAGTFGVGTANPDSNYKIDCNGRLRIGDGNAGHRIQFSRSGLGDELVIGVDGYGSSTNNEAVIQSSVNSGRPLVLRTSDGDRLRIAANGRVGIWETEAKIGTFAESLQVRGLYGNQYAIAAKINQSSGSLMRFSTKNPTNGNDDLCGSITGNGTSCSYNTSSDYRLKENDVKISDGISRLKQLRPIRFNWKSDSSFTQDGFFAHEVSPVVPESVTGEKDAVVDDIFLNESIDQRLFSKLLTEKKINDLFNE